MEGEVRMTVADYANAVKVYEKLVGVAPRVAAFHLRLAVAMACYPRTAKLAEREFYEAARLEPDNAEVHYQWGLYYKVMKIKSRAVAEMRTAVRLSPKHKAARAELEALSPKDSALTSLKKLFREEGPARSPRPDGELVQEGHGHEHEEELRLVGSPLLDGAPKPGGAEQQGQHREEHPEGRGEAHLRVPRRER
jgi:tetratricopeptide (TPR) repeat protein